MSTQTNDAALGGSTPEIDKALAAARARVEAKKTAGTTEGGNGQAKPAGVPKKNDAEKAAAKAAKDAERAQKKLERDKARDDRKAAKEAEKAAKQNAHMGKVAKAGAKLPQISDEAMRAVDAIVSAHTPAEAASIAAHISFRCRVQATEKALTGDVKVGDRVKITSGDVRYLGMEGTVERAQRIRCYVVVDGVAKPVYLFKSDVELVERPAAQEPTASN